MSWRNLRSISWPRHRALGAAQAMLHLDGEHAAVLQHGLGTHGMTLFGAGLVELGIVADLDALDQRQDGRVGQPRRPDTG